MTSAGGDERRGWALVTGAARRLGRRTAWALAEKGWDIVLHARQEDDDLRQTAEVVRALGGRVAVVQADLTRPEDVEALCALGAKLDGPLTALVNNAALFVPDTEDPDGSRHRGINLEVPLRLSAWIQERAALHGNEAAIVNLLDGTEAPPTFQAYGASKQALRRATLDLARTYAPRVRVNGVDPGPILPSPRESATHFQALLEATPLRRPLPPEAVGEAVAFLLMNPALTGVILPVDGGAHLMR